jgi:hypothetical protein
VSDYRMGDRLSIPGRGKGFSSNICVQTSSEAPEGPFPGGKVQPGRDADHAPHLVSR